MRGVGAVAVYVTVGWVFMGCSSGADRPLEPAAGQALRGEPAGVRVIAHRGASRVAPENTLAAFRRAGKAGADLVELDYHHSADDVPMVIHDGTLDRTTDVRDRWDRRRVRIAKTPSEEIRRLDAGSWFSSDYADEKIPFLDEALATIQKTSTPLIERKAGDPQRCLEALERMDMADQVVVQSFHWPYLRAFHEAAPEVTLAALGSGRLTMKRLRRVQATGARILSWSHGALDSQSVAKAHEEGFRVWAYTVNRPAEARRLIEAGVDGLITDRPKAIGRLASQQSRRW